MKFAIMGRILSYDGYGVKTFLSGLIKALNSEESNHEYILFVDHENHDYLMDLRSFFKVVRLKPKPSNFLNRLFWDHIVVGLACRRLGVDALYAPSHITPFYSSCPVVVTIHDMMYHLFPNDWSLGERIYFRNAVSYLTKKAQRITADSQSTRQDIIKILQVNPQKVNVLYPGVPEGFHPYKKETVKIFRERYNLQKPYILYSGSWHPRKNLPVLLDAFAKLTHLPHQLVIVGNPIWKNPEINRKISILQDRVRVLGLVPRFELPLFYCGADLFVMPSRYEGFGFPVLEAIACGCPTIAANTSSLPEVADHAAIYFDPENAKDLYEKMQLTLIDAKLRNEMKLKGLEQSKKFSWEFAARKLLDSLSLSAGKE